MAKRKAAPAPAPDTILDDLPISQEPDSGIPSFVQEEPEETPETPETPQTTTGEPEPPESPQTPPAATPPAEPTKPEKPANEAKTAADEPKKASAPPPAAPKVKVSAPEDVVPGPKVQVPAAPAAGPSTKSRALNPGEKISTDLAANWDRLLSEVSAQTRNAVWETGIDNLQKLLTTAKSDLTRPRGPMLPAQVAEVDAWLRVNLGLHLVEKRDRQPYVPPPPTPAADGALATRPMTSELAEARRHRLASMSGEFRGHRVR